MALPPGITPKTVTVGIASFFDGSLAEGTATIIAPVNVVHTPTNRPIFSSQMSHRFVDGMTSFNLCPTDAPGLNRVDFTYTLRVVISGALVQPEPVYFTLPTAGPDEIDLDSLVTVPSSAGTPIQATVVTSVNGQTGDVTVATGGGGTVTEVKKLAIASDSMGLTFATNLATGLGVETFDGARNGWSSTEVAALQGGLDLFVTLTGNQIPTGTGTTVATVLPTSSFGATTWLVLPGSLAGVPGILTKTGDTNQWRFQRNTAGSAVTVPPETRFISEGSVARRSWVHIFRVGRNNDADVANKIRDVKAMAASLGHNRYLVIPQYNGTNFATTNTQLEAAFGPNYYDLRGWLVRNGLAAAGITPTTDDTTAVNAGNIPPSLMADGTHLTTAGQAVEINRLGTVMVAKGWFDTYTPMAVPSSGTPALTNTVAPAITGTATVGSTLTVSNGTWSATPDSYTRQWKRAGADIAGATAATYVLVSADAGQTITCTVTAIKSGYTSGTATAAGVAVAAQATVTVTNLATNPRALNNTTGWSSSSGGGAATLTRVATGGPTTDAPSFLRLPYTTAATADSLIYPKITVTAGQQIRASAYGRLSWAGAKWKVSVGFFGAGSAFISSSTPISGLAAVANQWTLLDPGVVTAPTGAIEMQLIISTDLSTGSTLAGIGDNFDYSAVMATVGATLRPYRDGDSAGWAWTGTAHASTSTGPVPA